MKSAPAFFPSKRLEPCVSPSFSHAVVEILEARVAPATLGGLGGAVIETGVKTSSVSGTGGDGGDGVLLGELPAVSLSRNGRTATFTDVDGDMVTVRVSHGTLRLEDFKLRTQGSGMQLEALDFTGNSTLKGASVTVSARPQEVNHDGQKSGDGRVNVGAIVSGGFDLAAVRVAGDLGRIVAGDLNDSLPALGLLSVDSLGLYGTSTQNPADASVQSHLTGRLGKLLIRTDLAGATLRVDGAEDAIFGTLGSVRIGGNLSDAAILTSGNLGPVTIGGSVLALEGDALIYSGGSMGPVKIGHDLHGDASNHARVVAQGIFDPATVRVAQAIRSISVGGNVERAEILAGYDANFDPINSDVQIGAVNVKKNWLASSLAAGVFDLGEEGFGAGEVAVLEQAGLNPVVARIASVIINGQALGSLNASEHFGIEAEEIGRVQVGIGLVKNGPVEQTGNFRLATL